MFFAIKPAASFPESKCNTLWVVFLGPEFTLMCGPQIIYPSCQARLIVIPKMSVSVRVPSVTTDLYCLLLLPTVDCYHALLYTCCTFLLIYISIN